MAAAFPGEGDDLIAMDETQIVRLEPKATELVRDTACHATFDRFRVFSG